MPDTPNSLVGNEALQRTLEELHADQQRQDAATAALQQTLNAMHKETVNISLTTSDSGTPANLIGATVTIRERDTRNIIWQATWQGDTLTAELTAEYRYMVEFAPVSGYATPVYQRYNAVFGNVRTVTAQYIYLSDAVEVFYIDDNINDPATKISGTVNGPVAQWIRRNSHRYLMKKTGDGKAAICQLGDSDSRYYFDGTPAVLTGEQGDVITKWAPFFFDVNEVSTHKWEIQLALTDVTGQMTRWDDSQVLGTYEGYVQDGKLYSRSGVESTGGLSQATFKAYARARGKGYTIMKWMQHNIHALLFYSVYGHTNAQAKVGSGTSSYTKATGQTDALGMEDTVNGGNGSSGSINNYGVENSHGNKAEWIDNVTVDYAATGNVFHITEDDGTVRDVVTQAGADAYVWPTKMVLGKHFDLIAAPDNIPGGDSTGYCDGFYLSTASARVVYVSSYNAVSHGGVAYANADSAASLAYASVCVRLAFQGELTEYDDVTAFIELNEVA